MHNILINSAGGFDGTTPLDMSNPVYDEDEDRYEYNIAGPVGVFPLFTMPEVIGGGNVDLWIQNIHCVMPAPGATVGQQAQSGLQIPLWIEGTAPPLGDTSRYNFLHPQAWVLYGENQSTGPAILNIYLELLGNSNWYLLQCCHQYTPIPHGAAPA